MYRANCTNGIAQRKFHTANCTGPMAKKITKMLVAVNHLHEPNQITKWHSPKNTNQNPHIQLYGANCAKLCTNQNWVKETTHTKNVQIKSRKCIL